MARARNGNSAYLKIEQRLILLARSALYFQGASALIQVARSSGQEESMVPEKH